MTTSAGTPPKSVSRSAPPLSHPAARLLHSSLLCLGLGFRGYLPGRPLVSGHLVPSSPRQSSFLTSSFRKQWGLYCRSPPWLYFCVHCSLTAVLFALHCYNSVVLDSILGEYLPKHSKDLFTRPGLYYSEVPILG